MSHTHTPAEWAAFISLGTSFWATCAMLLELLYDADLKDFDPRPAPRRVVESGRLDVLLVAVVDARHELAPHTVAVRHAVYSGREICRDLAALLLLLTTTPKGVTR